MNTIYLILIVLHVLLSFMYAYDCYMEESKMEEAVFRGILCLLLPPLGYFFFWIHDYFVRKNGEERMRNLYLGNRGALEDFSLLQPIKVQSEMNKVPVLEALVTDDYQYRRKIIMETLKDEDIISYLPVLKRALENEDTETSHYASAVIMDAQKRAHEYLIQKEADFEANPDDREAMEKFEQELYKVIFGDVFDERNTKKYISTYQTVSDRLLKLDERKAGYFHNRITVDFEIGDVGHAKQLCEEFKREFPDNEDMVVDMIHLCVTLGNRSMLDEFLEELKSFPVFLTGKSLQYIRFFHT
ncbi:MAG: hypothetical protein KHZ58_15370 [Hungatella hathewayi]|nr:hypothetical protein [Hungatella hathewayi]